MSDKRWKAVERQVARRLGGRMVPITGRGRGDAPDIEHDTLSIEVKHRNSVPLWLREAISQAQSAARPGQLPIVVLHQHGARHADDTVLLCLADFERYMASMPAEQRRSGDVDGSKTPER